MSYPQGRKRTPVLYFSQCETMKFSKAMLNERNILCRRKPVCSLPREQSEKKFKVKMEVAQLSNPWSNNSPKGVLQWVLRACFPSMESGKGEKRKKIKGMTKNNHFSQVFNLCMYGGKCIELEGAYLHCENPASQRLPWYSLSIYIFSTNFLRARLSALVNSIALLFTVEWYRFTLAEKLTWFLIHPLLCKVLSDLWLKDLVLVYFLK